jgi:hypothetical protein
VLPAAKRGTAVAKPYLRYVVVIAIGMQAFSTLDAQMTSSAAEAQCRRTLETQNGLCASKPLSGWNSQQNCLERNRNFFERCMQNANVTNRNNNGYRNQPNQPNQSYQQSEDE